MGLTQTDESFYKGVALERHSAGLQNEGNYHIVAKTTLTCYHNQIKAMQTKNQNNISHEHWLKQT